MASPASSRDRAIAVLICLIGLESCGLGIVLLIVPRWFLRVTGFPTVGSDFFPSQSGVFLLILGICYLFALSDQAMIKVIVISKLAAVIFLVTHAAFMGVPQTIWLAAAGDGAMLLLLLGLLGGHPARRYVHLT